MPYVLKIELQLYCSCSGKEVNSPKTAFKDSVTMAVPRSVINSCVSWIFISIACCPPDNVSH